MSVLFRVVYAAHANGTHHKLALDALNHMQHADAEAWRRVFLKHVDKYLEGSKAPDNVFKDFKNHVLHVGESYWGGAPEKVAEWYGKTVAAIAAGNWPDAAYSAGVLSHYYTDPCMPFHTGQTEAENAIHRATEWSINRSYNSLRALAEARFPTVQVTPRSGANWTKEMTCDAAEYAHRYYEKLIAHYDIHRGVVVPEEGLDSISQKLVAELLMYAADGFGLLLDRAIEEAGVAAPNVSLTLETFLATLKIPSKWIEKKLTNAEDKKLVQAMYDELKATGRVDATLSEDDRTIRDLHAVEVLAPKLAKRQEKRAARLPDDPAADAPAFAPVNADASASMPADAKASASMPADAKASASMPADAKASASMPADAKASAFARALSESASTIAVAQAQPAAPVPAPKPAPVAAFVAPPVAIVAAKPPEVPVDLAPRATLASPRFEPAIEPVRAAAPAATIAASAPPASAIVTPIPEQKRPDPADRRSYLKETDPLEDAPSIGPKMAERFATLGIHTVADFLGHDPHDMAELLDDSRIDAEELTGWQDQAQLVIEIPGLRGGGAQLLVGAGYRTTEAIAESDPIDLSADVLTFATSSDGRRILRDGTPPDLEKIKAWVESAREALAA